MIAASWETTARVFPYSNLPNFLAYPDIVGFTTISSKLDPRKVANLLDRLYRKFDQLSDKYDVSVGVCAVSSIQKPCIFLTIESTGSYTKLKR